MFDFTSTVPASITNSRIPTRTRVRVGLLWKSTKKTKFAQPIVLMFMKLMKKLLATILLFICLQNSFATDCVTCKKELPENPASGVEGGAASIIAIANSKVKPRVYLNDQKLLINCISLEEKPAGPGIMNWLDESMAENKSGATVADYLSISNCCVSYYECSTIKKTVRAPAFHLIADNAKRRKSYLKFIYNSLSEKNQLNLWDKIVNAQNTNGQTLLDYVEEVIKQRGSGMERTPENNSLREVSAFLCSHGGVYTYYDMKCE